jgi:uncharacterized protein YacL (UPF0231 family)
MCAQRSEDKMDWVGQDMRKDQCLISKIPIKQQEENSQRKRKCVLQQDESTIYMQKIEQLCKKEKLIFFLDKQKN